MSGSGLAVLRLCLAVVFIAHGLHMLFGFWSGSGAGAGGAEDLRVELSVYDVAGRLTRRLVDRPLPPGKNIVRWDGWSDRGFLVPSGVYALRLEVAGKVDTRSVVVLH